MWMQAGFGKSLQAIVQHKEDKMKKYVMITGAAGGLGKSFVVEYAKRGYSLFITDINEESLKILAESMTKCYGVEVFYKTLNFLDEKSFYEYWEYVRLSGIKFNMLVNVAGVDFEGEFFEQHVKNIMSIAKINMLSVLGNTRMIVDYIDKTDIFRVINVSSLAGFYAMPFKATYSASKNFINSISAALNYELKEYNGSVTTLCPAGMATRNDCIESIKSQGFMGSITTLNTCDIVSKTIDYALKGKRVYVPGAVNNILKTAGTLLPQNLVSGLIYRRWAKTREIVRMKSEAIKN